jgi:hypothetical protein
LALTFHVHLLAITQNIPRSQALVELAAPRPHLTYYEAACDGCMRRLRARAREPRASRVDSRPAARAPPRAPAAAAAAPPPPPTAGRPIMAHAP